MRVVEAPNNVFARNGKKLRCFWLAALRIAGIGKRN
jgi:hypothetical protein